jgi:mxaA protein
MLLTALASMPWQGYAQTIIKQLEYITPRAYGYVIGDELEYRLRLDTDSSFRLDPDSLPAAGRLNTWLELRPPLVNEHITGKIKSYDIVLTYQLINAPYQLETLFTPSHTLLLSNGSESLPVQVFEWGFTASPLISKRAAASTYILDLQPEHFPPLMPVRTYVRNLALFGLVIISGLLFLLYAYGTIPFWRRTNGPFAYAYQRLQRLAIRDAREGYRDALRIAHQALNQTAGRVVFMDGLDAFFNTHPNFVPCRAGIERLFSDSRIVFFESTGISSDHQINWLIGLCRQCRDIERGLA